MALEKKLRAISPQPFTGNGDSRGKVTIADATLFKVEQIVTLRANAQPTLQLAVKDILDKNTLVVGPTDKPIGIYSDISNYTVAASASIESDLQVRPVVLDQDIQRATYEEGPTVARRVYLVDVLGKGIGDNNPLPVAATIVIDDVDNVVRFRKAYANANVEESQAIPSGTKKLFIQVSDLSAKMRVSFTANGTTDAGNDFTTVQTGNSYWREGLSLTGKTLYYQASKSNVVIEIEAWL